MPIDFATCLERDLVFARWTGVVRTIEYRDNFRRYVADQHYRPGRPELVDLTELENFAGDYHAMRENLSMVNDQDPVEKVQTRTALLAPRDSIYGLARMYQQIANRAGGIVVGIFRDEADALKSFDLPYSDVAELLRSEAFVPPKRKPQSGVRVT